MFTIFLKWLYLGQEAVIQISVRYFLATILKLFLSPNYITWNGVTLFLITRCQHLSDVLSFEASVYEQETYQKVLNVSFSIQEVLRNFPQNLCFNNSRCPS